MKFNKKMLLLYAITDRAFIGRQTLYEQVEDALKGGITMLQLREKTLDTGDFIKEAEEIKTLCRKYNVPLIINDRLDVALAVGADGIHVGIDDMPIEKIRTLTGSDFIIGATAKTIEQAKAAEYAGADYLGAGAVFTSPTKKNAVRITKEQLSEICSSVNIPTAAIGGICLKNICMLKGSGAEGIAVVSDIFASKDIQKHTFELKNELKRLLSGGAL